MLLFERGEIMPDKFDTPVTKVWWTSKTLWFNVITLLLDIVVALQGSVVLQDKANVIMILSLVQTTGNVILRFISTQPLTLKR